MTTNQLTCVQASLDVGEDAFGTATKYGMYIAIEWNQPWPAKAVPAFVAKEFPEEKGKKWQEKLKDLPTPKVQLIRRPNTKEERDGIISVYVAVTTELHPHMYAFEFSTYDEILELDFQAMLKKDDKYKESEIKQRVFLVCTHGRRDVCCAKEGLPLFNEMNDFASEEVWQTSHVSGHRFAANVLCLPHGLMYGRVGVDKVIEVVQSYRQGRVLHQFYRGRACYDKLEQAAEYFLRLKSSRDSLNSFELQKTETLSDQSTSFVFKALSDRHLHHVQVEQTQSEWKIPASTGDTELKGFPIYTLVSYRVSQADDEHC